MTVTIFLILHVQRITKNKKTHTRLFKKYNHRKTKCAFTNWY